MNRILGLRLSPVPATKAGAGCAWAVGALADSARTEPSTGVAAAAAARLRNSRLDLWPAGLPSRPLTNPLPTSGSPRDSRLHPSCQSGRRRARRRLHHPRQRRGGPWPPRNDNYVILTIVSTWPYLPEWF